MIMRLQVLQHHMKSFFCTESWNVIQPPLPQLHWSHPELWMTDDSIVWVTADTIDTSMS